MFYCASGAAAFIKTGINPRSLDANHDQKLWSETSAELYAALQDESFPMTGLKQGAGGKMHTKHKSFDVMQRDIDLSEERRHGILFCDAGRGYADVIILLPPKPAQRQAKAARYIHQLPIAPGVVKD